MGKNQTTKSILDTMSPKVKMALASLVDTAYRIEKEHTVVIMPFFGLLHSQGNESKPFLNYVDINILDIMNKQFKDIIVYPGENRYLSSYGLPLSAVEHLAHEQNILSRIVNKTTNFSQLSTRHKNIISLYENALADFENMKKKHPLPYRTAFAIETPEDLVAFVKETDQIVKKEDKKNKVCLICPISYLTELPTQTYATISKTIREIGGTLYFAQNQSDRYIYTSDNQFLYDDQYEENIVQSIQDFANTYNKNATKQAKKKLHIKSIISGVQNGDYGSTEKEIVENLEQIDVEAKYTLALQSPEREIKK